MTTTAATPLRLDLQPAGLGLPFLVMSLCGLVFAGMGGFFTWLMFSHTLIRDPGPTGMMFAAILFIPATLMGLALFVAAIAGAIKKVTLIVDQQGLIAITFILGIHRRRYFSLSTLRQLKLRLKPVAPGAVTRGVLIACLSTGEQQKVLARYGADECTRLAAALRVALWPDPAHQPSPATFDCSRRRDDILIHMNPLPIGSVLGGIYYVGIVLALGMPLFSIALLVMFLLNDHGPFRIIPYIMLPIINLIFIALGIALCRWVRRIAGQQADILLTPEILRIDITAPGAPAHYSWPRDQIKSIAVTAGNFSINGQYLQQLTVHLRSGQTTSLFPGRDADDLRWLAQTLHAALALPNSADARAALLQFLSVPTTSEKTPSLGSEQLAAIDAALKNSNIHRLPSPEKLILNVDPLGMRRASFVPIIAGCIFGLFDILFLIVLFAAPQKGAPIPAFTAVSFFIAFLIPPAFAFLYTRRVTRASARIEITSTELFLEWDALLQKKNLRLACGQITAIKGGWTAAETRGLQFLLTNDTTITVMDLFTVDELKRLAQILTLTLGLPPSPR